VPYEFLLLTQGIELSPVQAALSYTLEKGRFALNGFLRLSQNKAKGKKSIAFAQKRKPVKASVLHTSLQQFQTYEVSQCT